MYKKFDFSGNRILWHKTRTQATMTINMQGHKEKSPFFTVIIPSKNRAKYLHHTLRTCTMQDYEPLEIIVSDDGSTDHTREVVEDAARHDSRIRFISVANGRGMLDNFEFALRQIKPGYVIALGGDDGLLPDGIKSMCNVLGDTGMDLLAWPAPVYSYPNVHGVNGQLVIHRSKNSIKRVESRQFLWRQAKRLHYLSDVESPMFYVKGVASTRLIEKVRNRSPDGRFYSCPTPDGYSGIVLAGEVSSYAFSGKPFSIYGQSPTSQGLAYLSNSEKAKKDSQDFFENVATRPMHRELAGQPYSPLITLMTVDYLLTAKDLPGWPGNFPTIDYRQVLNKSIKELAHGLYGDERIRRELVILNRIAEKHGLSDYFLEKVQCTKRFRKRSHFEGSGINASAFMLDGGAYNLQNIFDASYAAQYLYQAYSDLSFTSLAEIFVRSLMYRCKSIGKGGPLSHFSQDGLQKVTNG